MKRFVVAVVLCFALCVISAPAFSQCSICTKTAQQLGEKPARGLNFGILYLAFVPFAIVGVIGYRWWKRNGVPA